MVILPGNVAVPVNAVGATNAPVITVGVGIIMVGLSHIFLNPVFKSPPGSLDCTLTGNIKKICSSFAGLLITGILVLALTSSLEATLIAAAEAGLDIYEYAPRRVKQVVTGNGSADKQQVAFMVRTLLGLTESPPHDAADAIAIAIAHLTSSDPLKAALLKRNQI